MRWRRLGRCWAAGCGLFGLLILSTAIGLPEKVVEGLLSPGIFVAGAMSFGRDDGMAYLLIFLVDSLLFGLVTYCISLGITKLRT